MCFAILVIGKQLLSYFQIHFNSVRAYANPIIGQEPLKIYAKKNPIKIQFARFSKYSRKIFKIS